MCHASIYSNATYKGCSLDGISERATSVTIVNIPGMFVADGPHLATAPAVILESHVRGIARLVPAVFKDGQWQRDKTTMWQAGGAYVATSDSRFSDAIERLTGTRFYGAIPLHDRALNKERRFGYDD